MTYWFIGQCLTTEPCQWGEIFSLKKEKLYIQLKLPYCLPKVTHPFLMDCRDGHFLKEDVYPSCMFTTYLCF